MGNKTSNKKEHADPDVYLKVDDINKRTLGMLILKTVGNEGAENDQDGEILRRQVQTCISNITEHDPAVWKNSRVLFLAPDGHEYVIQSGRGHHRFLVHLDGKNEIMFVQRK